MTGIGEIDQNVCFWAKMGYFWHSFCPGKAKTGFFGKKRKCHFRKLIMPQLCGRNQNKPKNGFWDLKCTDARTNGRTDGGEFKGPNRLRRGTNNSKILWADKKKLSKWAIFGSKWWFIWSKMGRKIINFFLQNFY